MIFSGEAVQVRRLDAGVAELRFDLRGGPVNKLDRSTLRELRAAIAAISADAVVRAVMLTSGKRDFVVGADIAEFQETFQLEERPFIAALLEVNATVFNALEDLPVPTVAAVNGLALGGGLEVALTCDYRVMAGTARIGLPETSLGIIPGYGGTVRLPRLIGLDNAIEWIVGGGQYGADAALRYGAVDAIVAHADLEGAAAALLQQCLSGRLDYLRRRREKLAPLTLTETEALMAFNAARAMISGRSAASNSAPAAAIETMTRTAFMRRDDALPAEAAANAKLAHTPVARNLIGQFIGKQRLLKEARKLAAVADPVARCGVLGAGIMGGGIAYQTALKGLPVIMKDISRSRVDARLADISGALSRQVERGSMTPQEMAAVLNRIEPARSYAGFGELDLVVEAVIESADSKLAVLTEAEACLQDRAVLASNTSTMSITHLSRSLRHPGRFCGMHFFNPVHRMELVEVVRGQETSTHTIARAVGYALALGKKPVVVNDCPGFLVNRILAPYLNAFLRLVNRGVDIRRIDRAMEDFGWPMGPAQLCDVIGLDTLQHGNEGLIEAYPDRLTLDFRSGHDMLVSAGRLGQKSGRGYYAYEPDKHGRMTKVVDPEAVSLLASAATGATDIDDAKIVEHMMLPLCLEAVRCLEENIAASANDIDMALVYGLGFPAFRGGPLRYLDDLGLESSVKVAERYRRSDGSYHVPETLRQMVARSERFYP